LPALLAIDGCERRFRVQKNARKTFRAASIRSGHGESGEIDAGPSGNSRMVRKRKTSGGSETSWRSTAIILHSRIVIAWRHRDNRLDQV